MPGEPFDNPTGEHADTPESLPALARALKVINAPPPSPLSTGADAEVRQAIRSHFAARTQRGASRRLAVGWSVAAAAVLGLAITAWVLVQPPPPAATTPTMTQAGVADVDHSGRVDILDALALARMVEAQADASAGPDINGDGVTDHQDADAIAMQAVSISGGSKS